MQMNLSDSEWKLMNHLWDGSPHTITELTAAVKDETGWSKNTVITMLDPELQREVDEMLESNRYTYVDIVQFLKENGVRPAIHGSSSPRIPRTGRLPV